MAKYELYCVYPRNFYNEDIYVIGIHDDLQNYIDRLDMCNSSAYHKSNHNSLRTAVKAADVLGRRKARNVAADGYFGGAIYFIDGQRVYRVDIDHDDLQKVYLRDLC